MYNYSGANTIHILLIIMLNICIGTVGVCPKVVAAETGADQVKSGEKEIYEKADLIYEQYLSDISYRESELSDGSITIDGITMKLYFEKIGEPDEKGYPLYIALRGGGTGDTMVAEEQFDVMREYYNLYIPNGIYVAPKCFISYYDEHYRPESFLFYDRIIEDAIAFYNVDPNRIYLVGFSSGGDGVYVVAPHLADRYAAVCMSAGYPHELRLENMYNLPICLQVGENDTAYDRNIEAAKYDGLLDKAARKYGGGFPHQTFIHVNGTHNEYWDDCTREQQKIYTGDQVSIWLKQGRDKATISEANTCAIDWMNQYVREPLPQRILWQTDEGASLRKSQAFYWLDRDGDLSHALIGASYNKERNEVEIDKFEGVSSGVLKIYLNPEMLNVFDNVLVNVLGKKYTIKPVISEQIMRSTLYARGDKNYMFTSEIDVEFGIDGKPLSVKPVSEAKKDYDASNMKAFYWNENGLFYVREDLFGLSYMDLRKETGLNLPIARMCKDEPNTPYRQWVVDGSVRIYVTSVAVGQDHRIYFLFQNGKCVAIYCEMGGKITQKLSKDHEGKLGELVNGLSCKMYMEDFSYKGKYYTRQLYKWYQLEEWTGMYETIGL